MGVFLIHTKHAMERKDVLIYWYIHLPNENGNAIENTNQSL